MDRPHRRTGSYANPLRLDNDDKGRRYAIRLENTAASWAKEVRIAELPKKQPMAFKKTGDEGFIVDAEDFANWELDPLPKM